MTPYDEVRAAFNLPFELYPFQIEDVNATAPRHRVGLFLDAGLGKTAVSTHNFLFKKLHGCSTCVVIAPPTLLVQWQRWLAKIKPAFNIVLYRGSPAERKQIDLKNADFIIMSIQIFKIDFQRLVAEIPQDAHVIADEAHNLKDISTKNHKNFRAFCTLRGFQLLTATPLNRVLDAYSYIRLTSPAIYRSFTQFENMHVSERDFFKQPTAFCNLDVLTDNLAKCGVRRTKEDVLPDLPAALIAPIEYELSSSHMKLYRRIAEEQLLKLGDNEKIDLTQATALLHALGQTIVNLNYFAQDDTLVSAAFEVLDEVLEELGGKKLMVFANYRRSNALIQSRYNCPSIYGAISSSEKEKALGKFLNDDKCKLITLHVVSGGTGLDGFQHVCQDVLYLEPPIAVSHFVQSYSRVHRVGQQFATTVRLATALGTLQVSQLKRLSEKEGVIAPIQGNKSILRDILFGA